MILKIAVVAIAAAIGIGYTYFFKQPDDNPVEEAAEKVIKDQTDVDVDLTPSSPEQKESK